MTMPQYDRASYESRRVAVRRPDPVNFEWTPGMTEAEFFNKNIACGDFWARRGSERSPLEGRLLHPGEGCGTANWRVFREPWMHSGQRRLSCQACGATTDVDVPAWTKGGNTADEHHARSTEERE